MPHLLVTGFGPFPGMPANPSGVLARRFGGLPRIAARVGAEVRVRVLTTAYAAIPAELVPALAEEPVAVLMIGVTSRGRQVRVEIRARNRASRLFPDASGGVADGLALDGNGPAERRSPVGARSLAALRRHGVRAIRSQDAGRYLCNATYFRGLAEGIPVLFLHIPPVPRKAVRGRSDRSPHPPRDADLAAALVEVARVLVRDGRRLPRGRR